MRIALRGTGDEGEKKNLGKVGGGRWEPLGGGMLEYKMLWKILVRASTWMEGGGRSSHGDGDVGFKNLYAEVG